ncbi:hypothetical protein HYC85_019523 [Camellia sinensis]|uniref:Uncharacterized protein n=1 Tax=Camellia sinensis TaxID=4442 RepID=A0A7J7GPP4_CAMSI|nr:hypothetical protein HYC85_019523 [Camellia sinensis]
MKTARMVDTNTHLRLLLKLFVSDGMADPLSYGNPHRDIEQSHRRMLLATPGVGAVTLVLLKSENDSLSIRQKYGGRKTKTSYLKSTAHPCQIRLQHLLMRIMRRNLSRIQKVAK